MWRNKRKERNERQRAAQELVGSARAITAAFRNAASALRVASRSNGSLEGWADDDRRLQESLDGIRRDASGDLWAQIERFDTILKRLREEQREKHEMPSKEAGELSQGFEGVADAVNAAYPKSRSGER